MGITTTKMKARDIYKTMRDLYEYYIKDLVPRLPTTKQQWTAYGFLVGGSLLLPGCKHGLEEAIRNDKVSNPPIVKQQEQKDLEERCDWALAKHSYSLYLVGTDSYEKLKIEEGENPVKILEGPPTPQAYPKRENLLKRAAAYYIIDAVDEKGNIIHSYETCFSGFVYADPGGRTEVPPNEEQLYMQLPYDPKITFINVWYAKMNQETKELEKVKPAIDPLIVPKYEKKEPEPSLGLPGLVPKVVDEK